MRSCSAGKRPRVVAADLSVGGNDPVGIEAGDIVVRSAVGLLHHDRRESTVGGAPFVGGIATACPTSWLTRYWRYEPMSPLNATAPLTQRGSFTKTRSTLD